MPTPLDSLNSEVLDCPLAGMLAVRMRDARMDLTTVWLERIAARVSIDPNRVFPTEELLDHVPLLIEGVADYLEDPERPVVGEAPVMAKAMELGALRLNQGFDAYEILKEFEIFGGILFSFLSREVDTLNAECSRRELVSCTQRLFTAVALIQQACLTHYVQIMKDRLRERENRMRAFNRMVTHELKNNINAALGAAQIMEEETLPDAQRRQLASIAVRNTVAMRDVLDNLLELSRLDQDSRQQRHVGLASAAAESVRQLREAARSRGVEIRCVDLPNIEVNAAAVELAITNLVSNAIKYADRTKSDRWVEVRARIAERSDAEGSESVVEVHDNGVGIAVEDREKLFTQFFRAGSAMVTGAEGTGLGLSIVRETVASLGGRVWAEFPGVGSVFAFALPLRREIELEAAESAS